MKKSIHFYVLLAMMIGLTGCDKAKNKNELKIDKNGTAILSDELVEEIVKRSYQYVAMFNVNNKFALEESGMSTRGYNKGLKSTKLLDHTVKSIARPNNDNLYQMAMLDLRKDAAVFSFPAFDSKYVSLMATGYDHYVNVPLSTTVGDFKEPITVLLYSARTENYDGSEVKDVDRVYEMTGDFVSLVLRIMPHANDKERYERITDQIEEIKGMSLAEFQGKPKLKEDLVSFPDYGTTDADIFGNNLLEVMQFVINHTTFDPEDELDQRFLEIYQPLGLEPGKKFDAETAVKIDGEKFRQVSLRIKGEELAKFNDPAKISEMLPTLFQTKGNMSLESLLLQSVVGPIGLPMREAVYPPIQTSDGGPMNAQNDYVIRMDQNELPPAKAFWSLTLYDTENGFFIPNDQNKYSVGENAGVSFNADGGLEVYIAAEKPQGVTDDNWLPINRLNQNLDIVMRIYGPDLEKLKDWKAPVAEKIVSK